MATLTKGYNFATSDVVTPTKLNNLVDSAQITNIANTDISDTAGIAHSKLASLAGGAMIVGNSTNVPTARTITGDVTFSNAGAATIAGLAVTEGKLGNNAVTNAKLRDSAGLSVIGNATNATADPTDIAAGTDGHVLRRSGTALGFGTVAAAGIADGAITPAKLNGAQSGLAPIYGCRAWVNFDGTRDSTGTSNLNNTNRFIRASGNVSSVLRNATGDYTITFTIAMQDNSYCVNLSGTDQGYGSDFPKILTSSGHNSDPLLMSPSQVRVAGAAQDWKVFCLSVFR